MIEIGMNFYDVRQITLISALISAIGPLVVGFILDRISVKRPSAYGKWLRIFLFVFFILAGIFFGSLLLIAPGYSLNLNDTLTFSCIDSGSHLFIKKSITNGECQNIDEKLMNLKLTNCSYTCEAPMNFKHFNTSYKPAFERLQKEVEVESNEKFDSSTERIDNGTEKEYDYDNLPEPIADALIQAPAPTSPAFIPPPHICKNESGSTHCYVYLDGTTINLENVKSGIQENYNDDFCIHPLGKISLSWFFLL
jgi:hypothetical protein